MHRDTLDRLACTACRLPLTVDELETVADRVLTGTLLCPGCAVQVPIRRGFAMFTEADIDPCPQDADLAWFDTRASYEDYRRHKHDRDQLEIYAAFHPFNEATRAGEAVLPLLAQALRPGDAILDPWCRTGWNAVYLAHCFPEQRVVALIEGNRDVLGYRGVAHWLADNDRPANLDIMFVHPAKGLPFRDKAFAAVFSHDCLHRFPIEALGSNLLRVATANAPLVFAHVHLANSEPDPWFDRGCTIRHGRSYRDWLDRICAGTPREGRVLSEADLFTDPGGPLPADSWDMTHYNALIVVADAAALREASRTPLPLAATTRFLLNPLYRLHLERRSVRIERGHHDGMVGEMLDRHPVYERRLARDSVALSDTQLAVLALALVGESLAEIAALLGLTCEALLGVLAPLMAIDLVRPAPVSRHSQALQRFHANQLPPTAPDCVLSAADLASTDAMLISSDGSHIGGSEIPAAVDSIRQALISFGVSPASSIALGAAAHPLVLLVLLAAMDLGCEATFDHPGDLSDFVLRDSDTAGDDRRQVIPMGWDGEPDTLLSRMQSSSGVTVPRTNATGAITLSVGANTARLPWTMLCEMASSFRNGIAPINGSTGRPDRLDGLLLAITALSDGKKITIAQ